MDSFCLSDIREIAQMIRLRGAENRDRGIQTEVAFALGSSD